MAYDCYVITHGTEHKIWESPGGDSSCFTIRSLATGAPARAHFRRTRAGHNKDLDIHTGAVCWTAKIPLYILYATAVDEDIRVCRDTGSGPPSPGANAPYASDDDDAPLPLTDEQRQQLLSSTDEV